MTREPSVISLTSGQIADLERWSERQRQCANCQGSGVGRKPQPYVCPECGGSGEIEDVAGYASLDEDYEPMPTCPRCPWPLHHDGLCKHERSAGYD